jgi:hypothetical protein
MVAAAACLAVSAQFGAAQTVERMGNMPLEPGREIEQGKKYLSASGSHYLIFASDGKLAVKVTSDDSVIWSSDKTSKVYDPAKAVSAKVADNGNLKILDAAGKDIWYVSGKVEEMDHRSRVDLTQDGVLKLISDRRADRWSTGVAQGQDSDDYVRSVAEKAAICNSYLKKMHDNKYDKTLLTTEAAPGRLPWATVAGEFKANLDVCLEVGEFLDRLRGTEFHAAVHLEPYDYMKVEDVRWGEASLAKYFSRLSYLAGGMAANCRGNDGSRINCGLNSDRIHERLTDLIVQIDVIANLDCMPFDNWGHCRLTHDAKNQATLRIVGSQQVTDAVLDQLAEVYAIVLGTMKPHTADYEVNGVIEKRPHQLSDMMGVVAYVTNGEDEQWLKQTYPMDSRFAEDPNSFRGGASKDIFWISEQLICKTGIATKPSDTITRTYDQVIHEFAHVVDNNYELSSEVVAKFRAAGEAQENFAGAVQSHFNAYDGRTYPQVEVDYVKSLFEDARLPACPQ